MGNRLFLDLSGRDNAEFLNTLYQIRRDAEFFECHQDRVLECVRLIRVGGRASWRQLAPSDSQ